MWVYLAMNYKRVKGFLIPFKMIDPWEKQT